MVHDVEKLLDYSNRNGLKMNFAKTKVIEFGRKILGEHLRVLEHKIPSVKSCKILGVTFDTNMKFKTHISKSIAAANYRLFNLRQWRNYLPPSVLLALLCNLVIYPMLYGSGAWGSCLDHSQMRRLQVCQNFAAKIFFGRSKFDSNEDFFKRLEWVPVDAMIKLKTICIAHAASQGEIGNLLLNKFISIDHGINTRAHEVGKFKVPFPKQQSQKSFSYQGPSFLNDIPTELKEFSGKTFRKKVLKHMRG